MHDRARLLAGNPAAVAGACGDFSVQRHRPFRDDPRPAGRDEFQVGSIEPFGFRFHQPDFDFDPGLLERFDSAAADGVIRIMLCTNHSADPGGD